MEDLGQTHYLGKRVTKVKNWYSKGVVKFTPSLTHFQSKCFSQLINKKHIDSLNSSHFDIDAVYAYNKHNVIIPFFCAQ